MEIERELGILHDKKNNKTEAKKKEGEIKPDARWARSTGDFFGYRGKREYVASSLRNQGVVLVGPEMIPPPPDLPSPPPFVGKIGGGSGTAKAVDRLSEPEQRRRFVPRDGF